MKLCITLRYDFISESRKPRIRTVLYSACRARRQLVAAGAHSLTTVSLEQWASRCVRAAAHFHSESRIMSTAALLLRRALIRFQLNATKRFQELASLTGTCSTCSLQGHILQLHTWTAMRSYRVLQTDRAGLRSTVCT